MNRITSFSEWIEHSSGISTEVQLQLLYSAAAIFLLMFLRWVLLSVAFRTVADVKARYHWRKTTSYITFFLGLLVVGQIWVESIQSLATFLGLLTAGIAIALRDPLVNLAGWAFILWRKPFIVGDRIQTGQVSGDVIDIRLFQFSLVEIGNWVDADQSTGRIIHVPNSKVFTDAQANYTAGFTYIWEEVPVLITFESDWRKAKEILTRIVNSRAEHLTQSAEKRVKEASQRFMIFYNKLTPIVYTSVRDSGVLLTMRFMVGPRKRRSTQEAIWEDVLDEFAKHPDIDFAYPTQRVFSNFIEGKAGAKVDLQALLKEINASKGGL